MGNTIVTKAVLGYEGLYEVDTAGNVWSVRTNSKLKYRVHNGYCWISLYKDGKRKLQSIHRIVALTFIPNPDNKPEVNHKDGDKTNNVIGNLEWFTKSENVQHAVDNFGMNCGERQWRHKLTEEEVLDIYYNQTMSIDDLAIKYDIARNYIFRIRRAGCWKWLLEPLERKGAVDGV